VVSVERLQEWIAAMMQSGRSLDWVESEVIDPSELSADRKAALWLYAWSFVDRSEQRATATFLLGGAPA
jgi:hypothetical protein